MDAARWSEVRRVFEDSLDLPDESRAGFIQSASSDPEVQSEVLRLITLHSAATDFLETPPTLVLELKQDATLNWVFRPGDRVADRFRVVRLIGFGGMGEVYEAEDEALGNLKVALKTVRGFMAGDDHLRARFRTEVEMSRKVTHPNVCRIHDLGVHRFENEEGRTEEVSILTMELLEGETLLDRLRSAGPLKGAEAWHFAVQTIEALQAAHDAGVIHGDLKPNNIMLTRDAYGSMRVKVTDFGLARGLSAEAGPGEASSLSFNAGAPAYMAPELIDGQPASARTDMYALGALLYEAFTGERPFPEIRTFEQARQKRESGAPQPRAVAPELDARLDALVRACLEPDAEKRCASPAEARSYLRPPSGRRVAALLMLLVAAVSGVIGWWWFKVGGSQGPVTVAVLPLENGSGEPGAEYFARGLTDEIRESLARSPRTRVPARESSAQVSRARLSDAAAGGRLGADYVVAGNVRKSDGRLRVKVRLVRVSSGEEVWTHEFDKPESDLASARLEIGAAIATRLHGNLAPQALAAMAQGSTGNSQAFHLYLQARNAMDSRQTSDLETADRLFGEALKYDPRFPLAWAARAEVRELLAGTDRHPFIESMTEARELALRALELDPELPEGLLELAMIRQRFEWDWKGAEEAFRRSVERNANSAEAHRLYAGFLSNLGRSEEAMAQIELALGLDPLAFRVRQLRAVILLRSRRYAEAVEALQTLLNENPGYQNLYAYAGDAYGMAGQWGKALELHREAVRRFGEKSELMYNLAYALAKNGQSDQARRTALDLEARWPENHFLPTYLAKVWFGLGDADRAFYWMEKAWTERDAGLVVLNVEPWYDPFRPDPRFLDLLRRMGLDQPKAAK